MTPPPRLRWFLGLGVLAATSPAGGPREGSWGDALAQEVAPESTPTAVMRARALAGEGRWQEAREILEEILDRDPTSESALLLLLQIGRSMGEPGAAETRAARAVARTGYGRSTAVVVWIRSLAASGRPDSAEAVARRWLRARPHEPAASSEVASLLTRAGRREEAVRVLRAGREAGGGGDLFAQEIASLEVSLGRYDRAAKEWATILGWGDVGVSTVEAGWSDPAVDGERAVAALRGALRKEGVSAKSLKGGLELARRRGDAEWSREIVAVLAERSPAEMRVTVLREFARDWKSRGQDEAALWAATRLVEGARLREERLYWTAFAAELRLRLGRQLEAERELAGVLRETERGSPAHRIALRTIFRVLLLQRSDEAVERLEEYRRAFPEDEREAADMAVELSRVLLRDGELETAGAVLPRKEPLDAEAAARIAGQRGRIALYAGQPVRARRLFRQSVWTGNAAEREELLPLAAALTRADSADAAVLGSWLYAIARHDGVEGARRQAESWISSGARGASALMEALARGLEREGFGREADGIRETLVERYPEAPEAPGAMLALARAAGADTARAIGWLERLVLGHPESAVAPVARRRLAELHRQVPDR